MRDRELEMLLSFLSDLRARHGAGDREVRDDEYRRSSIGRAPYLGRDLEQDA